MARGCLLALVLPAGAMALVLAPLGAGARGSLGNGGYVPAEATLRVAQTAATAWAGESFTLSCGRVPFIRAFHAEHARFWSPREHAYGDDAGGAAALQLAWFNSREAAYGDIIGWALAAADPAAVAVFDVGANTGWYSLFAAVRGFDAVGFDMQPECVRRARCASVVNRVAHRVALHNAYVTDGSDGGAFLPVAATTCFGGLNTAWEAHFTYAGVKDRVPPLHLGRHVADWGAETGRRVRVLKVDIEGGEVAVARSLAAAPGALQLVDHVVAEYSPHMWGDLNVSTPAGVAAFGAWFAAGFVAVDVPESRRIDPARWAAAPGTPDAPEFGLPRGSVLRSTADLARYTEWALATLQRSGGHIFTLWFFRPRGGGGAEVGRASAVGADSEALPA